MVKHKMATSMFENISKKLLLFSNKDPIFIANVSTKLSPLETLPGDWIYQSGEFAHSSKIIAIE